MTSCRFYKARAAEAVKDKATLGNDAVPPDEYCEAGAVMVLSGRSQKKWDELDVDQSGLLDGDEARLCPGTQAMLPGAD